MSNRVRLPSEKARTPRCPKCRSKDYQGKGGPGGVYVCMRCQHIWPKPKTT